MDLAKRRGQFEPVRITGDNPVDGIGAEPFVVEFFRSGLVGFQMRRGVWTVASAHALHQPSVTVQVF